MYKVVVFDVDGTLFDTSEGICNCINYVLEKNNKPTLSDEVLKKFIGPPIYKSFMDFCGIDFDTAMKYTEEYRFHYVEQFIKQSKPYPDMLNVLEHIKGENIKLAIATLKTQKQIDALLFNEGLEDLFDVVRGVRVHGEKKDDILKSISEELGISDYREMVLVGDTILDAEGAASIGVDFIGVTHGFGLRTEEDLKEYPYVALCNNFIDVSKIIIK